MKDLVVCYQNAAGEVLMLPTASDGVWVGLRINKPLRFNPEAPDQDLGSGLRLARGNCNVAFYDRDEACDLELRLTGEKTHPKFHKKWHLVNVFFADDIALRPNARDSRSYAMLGEEAGTVIPLSASDLELGYALRRTFLECRDGI